MLPSAAGAPELTVSSSPSFRIAVLAVLGALVLAGCGRKGGLDPPPAGAASAQEPAAAGGPQQGVGSEAQPVAPQGSSRRTPIDWLLD
jgi:predicted small lipoprotein YifL